MKELKKEAVNLLKVKSIVTLVLTAVFAYKSIIGDIDGQQFMTVFSVVIAFYFGTQYEKKAAKVAPEEEIKTE
jgi:hypothetical protein